MAPPVLVPVVMVPFGMFRLSRFFFFFFGISMPFASDRRFMLHSQFGMDPILSDPGCYDAAFRAVPG